MRRWRRWAVAAVLAVATACTPVEVQQWWAQQGGPPMDDETAEWWAEHLTRDCLPGHDADPYIECAVADSWQRYDLGRWASLDTWATIAWCESKLDPHARNRSSGALGLYQHLPRYWAGRAAAAGFGDDWANPRVNAFVSGWLASTSGLSHWRASAHCW